MNKEYVKVNIKMSEESKIRKKCLEMWEKEQLANECIRQYLKYRKAKEYIDELEDRIDKAIELIKNDYFEDGSGNNIEKVLDILRGE